MRVAIFDRVDPPMFSGLPLRLVETCSRRAALLMLAVTIPVVVGIGAFSLPLLMEAAFAPNVRTTVSAHPALAIEVLAGLAFWIYLLALPLKRLTDRISIHRTVEIDEGIVRVIEERHWRTRTWTAPLASYQGVAHHVRASISGTRHELILVHPKREKSVLLSLAKDLPQDEVDRVASLLGHKEIPASSQYRLNGLWPRFVMHAWRHPAHA